MNVGPDRAIAKTEERPSFLTTTGGDAGKSMSLLSQYVVPPRLKVMQKSRKEPLDKLFDTGDVVAMPMQMLVAGVEQPFHFVPIFFFPEYLVVNPYEVRSLEFIRERSYDPRCHIAVKARSKDTRKEPCPESPNHSLKNLEVLHFVIVIVDENNPMRNVPVTMSFMSGEYKYGQLLANLVRMRNVDQCYGCVFEGRTGGRKNEFGDWKGVNCSNPTIEGVSSFVRSEDDFKLYAKEFERMFEAHKEHILRPDVEAEPIDEAATVEAVATANGGGRF